MVRRRASFLPTGQLFRPNFEPVFVEIRPGSGGAAHAGPVLVVGVMVVVVVVASAVVVAARLFRSPLLDTGAGCLAVGLDVVVVVVIVVVAAVVAGSIVAVHLFSALLLHFLSALLELGRLFWGLLLDVPLLLPLVCSISSWFSCISPSNFLFNLVIVVVAIAVCVFVG